MFLEYESIIIALIIIVNVDFFYAKSLVRTCTKWKIKENDDAFLFDEQKQ